MSAQLATPLPECALCERPTRREVHEATGGLCSDCSATVRTAARK